MLSDSRLAGSFKFPKGKGGFSTASLCDLVSIFLNFDYAVSIEPKGDTYEINVYQTENFQNRPLPFGEDE